MLDRDAAVPLYHQIFLQLRDQILSGERPYGSSLPTEEKLAEMYSVSRITARRVLNDLAAQNFAIRQRRLGTTVTFRSPAKPIEANLGQTIESLLALGERTTVSVIEVSLQPASSTVAEMMRVPDGANVLRTVRVRRLDGVPLGYVVGYVPEALAHIVTREALEDAPILRLLKEAGHQASHAEQTIGAMLANGQLATALEIDPGAALLRISRTVRDAQDHPFLLTFAHYRGDRFHLRMDLQSLGED